MTSETELVLYNVGEDGVAVLTLNRPEKLNVFSTGMLQQWHDRLVDARDDNRVKVIILTGAGRAFCAGGDISGMPKTAAQEALERKQQLQRTVHAISLLMERVDKPVIAAMNGLARGAGVGMALQCDIRIAARSATLAETYINLGLMAGDGAAYYLPRLVGIDRALELFWTGRAVSAEEAERIGMVTRVVDDEEVMSAALELARKIASQPFESVRMYKRAVQQGLTMSLVAHLDMISSHTAVLRDTPDHRAKVRAFIERSRTKGPA